MRVIISCRCGAGGSGRLSEPVCAAFTAARLTCLATLDLSSAPTKKQSKARKAVRKAADQSDAPQKALPNGSREAGATDITGPQTVMIRELQARDGSSNADSAAAESSKQKVRAARAGSLPGKLKQKAQTVKGTANAALSPEQEQAKQESLKEAELKRKKRGELAAAAEAEKSGVLVQKEAETVVEFPEVSRPAKSAKKGKRHKGT